MKIDVYASHTHASEKEFRGKACVVIDTLRSTSVMITALNNGCEQIIPVTEVGTAMELKTSMGQDRTILGGERNSQKLGGFDLGNSPLEYTKHAVYGKTLVMATTNGTQAILKAREATAVYLGALLNATVVAKALLAQKKDTILLCAGTNGHFSIDDCITAGYIINRLNKLKGRQSIKLDDLGFVCYELYEHHKDNLEQCIANAAHYTALKDLGFVQDIEYCLKLDSVNVLPRFEDGRITLE